MLQNMSNELWSDKYWVEKKCMALLTRCDQIKK